MKALNIFLIDDSIMNQKRMFYSLTVTGFVHDEKNQLTFECFFIDCKVTEATI